MPVTGIAMTHTAKIGTIPGQFFPAVEQQGQEYCGKYSGVPPDRRSDCDGDEACSKEGLSRKRVPLARRPPTSTRSASSESANQRWVLINGTSTYQYRFIHQTLYCFSRWPSAQCAQS